MIKKFIKNCYINHDIIKETIEIDIDKYYIEIGTEIIEDNKLFNERILQKETKRNGSILE